MYFKNIILQYKYNVSRGLTTKRKYGEIVMPLQGVTDVMKHFKNYTDIPHIAQLATEVNMCLSIHFVLNFVIFLFCTGKSASRIVSDTNHGRFS